MRVLLRESASSSVAVRSLGTEVVGSDPVTQAAELFGAGVRGVVVRDPVRLGGGADPAPLTLLRELGAWGVSCRWELRVEETGFDWTVLSHLPPPQRASGAVRVDVTTWAESWFPCRCVQREGPGFLQIRDRRGAAMECYTVSDPELVRAARLLADGAAPSGVASEARERFAAGGLLVRLGSLEWWAPARVRRWPVPAMAV